MSRAPRWTNAQAQALIERLAAGELGRDLAAEAGVSAMTISNLRRGVSYPHLRRPWLTPSRQSSPGTAVRAYAAARFWVRVEKGEAGDCWPWAGTRLETGYGVHGLRALPGGTTAFKTAYLLANRLEAVPLGQVIRHLCGFKPCCNPAHLSAGTKRQNYDDGLAVRHPARSRVLMNPPRGGWMIQTGDLAQLRSAARAESGFWPRVDRTGGPDACWPWTGAAGPTGHGNLRWDPRVTTSTARVAWALTNGPIPDGLIVRHDCDNGACCNPRHLRLGTHADNRDDARRRNRIPSGNRHHVAVRIPDAVVAHARERVAAGESLTAAAIGAGVSITTVARWVAGASRLSAGGPLRQGRSTG